MTDKRYRSRFEMDFATFLEMNNVKYDYESQKIKYTPKTRTYTPDFHLLDYDILIETKGQFVTSDRKKHKLIKKQYGDKFDIRFVFSNPNARIGKKSKTTYADWCERYGFKYAAKEIPQSWINEKRT